MVPLCFIRSSRLFRRSALAFTLAICFSLVCFTAFPVTGLHLRAGAAQLNVPGPSHWAVSTIYTLDPPYNLFPSLHVSLTALAALAVWKTNRLYGALLFAGLALVVIAVCTTKQHFLFDVLGGLTITSGRATQERHPLLQVGPGAFNRPGGDRQRPRPAGLPPRPEGTGRPAVRALPHRAAGPSARGQQPRLRAARPAPTTTTRSSSAPGASRPIRSQALLWNTLGTVHERAGRHGQRP